MAAEPLKAMGRWRAAEGAIEAAAPLTAMGVSWYLVYSYVGSPATGRGLTTVEMALLFGAAVGVTGWAFSRQLFMLRKRKPWSTVITGWVVSGVLLAIMPSMSRSSFRSQCEVLGGEVVHAANVDAEAKFAAGCEGIGGTVVYDVNQEANANKYKYQCSVIGGEVVSILTPAQRQEFRNECETQGTTVLSLIDGQNDDTVLGYGCSGTDTVSVTSERVSEFERSCSLLDGTVLEGRYPATNEMVPYGCSSFESAHYERGQRVCRVGGVEDNSYLPGIIFRPNWDGKYNPLILALLGLVSLVSSLGLREKRLRRSRMGQNLFNLLRFTSGIGNDSAMGKPKAKGDEVVACTNPTFWGEVCGQLYSRDKKWEPGQWCSRCRQTFTPCDRYVTLKVVSLFTADVDVLNGIERLDTVGWTRGEPIVPDARISGEERWVQLGMVKVPDIISVAQLLAIVHELIPKWQGNSGPRVQQASSLAQRRASRVAAWFWFGTLAHRLTYARPNNRSVLGVGATRLRDVLGDGGEELWLQLDIGLFPMEVRTGFLKTFVEDDRTPRADNNKLDLWIPTSAPGDQSGLWVPRIEGDALRVWLSTDQLRDDDVRGVSTPLAYWRYQGKEGADPKELMRQPKPGTLDFVRMRLDETGMEPAIEHGVGASMAEWDWLEWEQIELLRQQALVLVERRR
ncbi:MAG: hypothetical protein ACJAZO_000194 [Myxococcota bacterium]